MPELPEVEMVMRGLRDRLEGQVIVRAVVHRPDLRWPFPSGLERRLIGARVLGFRRRGKYILMRLSEGDSVLLHLGMSGRVVLGTANRGLVIPHEHLVLETVDGWRVGLIDPRRFGSVDLVPTDAEETHKLLVQLGMEPLSEDFTPARLAVALAAKRSPLKTALIDQKVVAGLGNIYVCEALFRAQLNPLRSAQTIRFSQAARLVSAIRETLSEAIAAGGSSLRDYIKPDGELGSFQRAWKVYGRQGEACERCPGIGVCRGVRRIVQANRSTFYCPRIQR